MAARSVRVHIHNDTDAPLTLLSSECTHGSWKTRPPAHVDGHSTAIMTAESNFLGGVEGHATYQVGDDPNATLYMHWDNPTSGSNSYHTNTDAGHYAFWSAPTSGSDPEAHFILRPAGRVETDFLPSRDGFKFDNSWPNTPYSLPPLKGSILDLKYGNAENGLCGGMVLAAMDYFLSDQEIPQTTMAPKGERDPLFLYLVERIFDTFSVNSVSLLLKLMNPAYPDDDENVLSTFGLASGRAAVMAHQEWPLIRADIDAGKPSPVCIVTVKNFNPGMLGKNHQLLAYAYTVSGHDVTIHLYDPNQPGTDANTDNVTMKFNDGDVSHRIVVEHNIGVSGRPVYCFVRMDGTPKMPKVPTRHRLTPLERRERRVHIVREQQTTLSSNQINNGRRVFPVWPDCGEAEFDWRMYEDTLSSTINVTTPYYDQPKITWQINGVTVPHGGNQELFVRADTLRPQDDIFRPGKNFLGEPVGTGTDVIDPFGTETIGFPPPPFDPGLAIPQTVTLRTNLNGNRLEIVNDPVDGNYSLVVQVSVRESDDASTTTSRTTAVEIVGLREEIDGLEAASAGCWKRYLNSHQDQGTAPGAVAALLYSQLGRPADPLWDPDPTALNLGNIVEQVDPKITEIGGWVQEVKDLATAAQHAGPGHGGHLELSAEELQAKLAAQLGSITSPF